VLALDARIRAFFANDHEFFADDAEWDESKVHRGQPDNAGQFVSAGQAGAAEEPAERRKVAPGVTAGPITQTAAEEVRERIAKHHTGAPFRDPGERASTVFHKPDKPMAAYIDAIPGADREIEAAEQKADGAVDTNLPLDKGGFFNPKTGDYSPERKKVWAAIIDYWLSPDKIKAATPAAGEAPTLDFYGGRGGSGKSWFHRDPDSPGAGGGGVDLKHAIYINSDDIKENLGNYLDGKPHSFGSSIEWEGWRAAQFHEESSLVSKLIEGIARDKGLNVIFDGTMGSKSTLARIEDYKKAGYKTRGHYMFLPPEESIKRVISRFMGGNRDKEKTGEGPGGRFVPPHITFAGSMQNEKWFDDAVDAGLFDDWRVLDNRVARNEPPIPISGGGKYRKPEKTEDHTLRRAQDRAPMRQRPSWATDYEDWR
jgi:predicted ABC-type ATPase